MAKKTKKSTAINLQETVVEGPCKCETTLHIGQAAKLRIHGEENLGVTDNVPTTLGASVDSEATTDPRKKSDLGSNESTIS
jgi:hypothetical protein